MRVVLMGPPGAGKGTQSTLLAGRLGVPHLSSGDMLRSAIAAGTETGRLAKAHIDVGSLAPEAVILGVIADRLSRPDCAHGFVLDGFPRQVSESVALDGMLSASGLSLDLVVHVDVGRDVVEARVASRSITSARPDDGRAALARRLAVYADATEPVLARYASLSLLAKVDGTLPVPEVEEAVLDAMARRGLDVRDAAPVP